MEEKPPLSVLTINCGSSSLKISLFEMGTDERLKVSGEIERIGHEASYFRVKDSAGAIVIEQQEDLPTHDAALALFFNWLESYLGKAPLGAVGHRVVHGGALYSQPARVTSKFVLKSSLATDRPELAAVIEVMREFLLPPMIAARDGHSLPLRWYPKHGWPCALERVGAEELQVLREFCLVDTPPHVDVAREVNKTAFPERFKAACFT